MITSKLMLPFVTCSGKRMLLDKKVSFEHFSLQLRNNDFHLKRWINYNSIFMVSRAMNFITSSYLEVQF